MRDILTVLLWLFVICEVVGIVITFYGIRHAAPYPFDSPEETQLMILPNHAQCALIVAEILADSKQFSSYMVEWATSNEERSFFTDKQRELVHRWCQEYEFDCMKGYR